MTSSGQFVGLGPWRYRVERPWGKLPSELSYAGIADVTVMSSGKVAVLFRSDPAVLIFEPDGALAARWSMPEIVAGHYIRACASGRLFLGFRRPSHLRARRRRPLRADSWRARPPAFRCALQPPRRCR